MATNNQGCIGGVEVGNLYASLDKKEGGLILVEPPAIPTKLGVRPPDVKLRKPEYGLRCARA
eukprot:4949124-Prorocentrum_lima.AAC.1